MKILCTQPRSPELAGLPPDGAGDYLTTLEALLAGARDSVQIVCPFIDAVGADVLEAAYRRTGSRATWEIFTRDSPERLRNHAREHGWHLYEFRPRADPTDAAFHCKLFIVDSRKAVVGSANLIYRNLVENVEIGVLVDDEASVRTLAAVPRALKRAITAA